MNLSKAHRKAADYVLSNVFRSATMSIDELAHAVGISVATANRFARALGFEGYPQFRAELVYGFEAMLAPIDKLRTEVQRPATSVEVIASALNEDINNLDATRRGLVPEFSLAKAERPKLESYPSAFLGKRRCSCLLTFRTSLSRKSPYRRTLPSPVSEH